MIWSEMKSLIPVRVRFAPSPTGHMHLGSARTALYDYLLAQKTGGKFILRIEDTDRKRFVEGTEQELMDGMLWLGIHWDEGPDVGGSFGPYRQSERKDIYLRYATQLIESGKAFYCFCSPERLEKVRQEQQKRKESPHYDGTCRNLTLDEARKRIADGEKYVIRFKTPKEGTTTIHDLIRGDITIENRTIDDYILVKSDGWALYHLAAIVDDHEMRISHVIRGSEWLSTFPLHALIIRAFGWQEPEWVHLSVFLKPSGKGKMSKREAADLVKDGYSIFIKDLQGLGYLPEAVVNWIALMGWAYDDHTELFSMDDLVEKFSLDRLNPSPAAINFTKLDHFNGIYIRQLKIEDLAKRIKPFFIQAGYKPDDEKLMKIAPIIQERIATLEEAVEMAGFFFRDKVEPNPDELVAKGLTKEKSCEVAVSALEILRNLPNLQPTIAEAPMRSFVEGSGLTAGQVFGILRVAITGQKISPPLFESMEIVGREKVIQRLETAIKLLS
jgi:glutamyl-tRNA synthetase